MELIFLPLLILGLLMFFGMFALFVVMSIVSAFAASTKRRTGRDDRQVPLLNRSNVPVANPVHAPVVQPSLSPDQIRELASQEQVILIRCTDCRTLNEEDGKFCRNCGASLL